MTAVYASLKENISDKKGRKDDKDSFLDWTERYTFCCTMFVLNEYILTFFSVISNKG